MAEEEEDLSQKVVRAETKVARNPNIAKLQAGYLFPEINRIKNEHLAEKPDAQIISLGRAAVHAIQFNSSRWVVESAPLGG